MGRKAPPSTPMSPPWKLAREPARRSSPSWTWVGFPSYAANLHGPRPRWRPLTRSLRSTIEELETTNEELQSTNEELEGINSELRERTVEVEELNFFLESILGSLRSAVIVLDTDMHVHAWNRNAEDLWGLRRDEVNGQHFFNLDIGFPVVQLRDPIRSCLTDAQTVFENDYHAVNRRGRTISCRVAISPLRHGEATRGVIISMESASLDGVGETSPAALDPSR